MTAARAPTSSSSIIAPRIASIASTRRCRRRSTISRCLVRPGSCAPLVFPLRPLRSPARDKAGKAIVRAALQPGEFRDRLTRDIFITDDPSDPARPARSTRLIKVIAAEDADKKLERAIRKGEVTATTTTIGSPKPSRRASSPRRSAHARRGSRSHGPRHRRRSFRCRPSSRRDHRRPDTSRAGFTPKDHRRRIRHDHADAAPHTSTTGASRSITRASPGRSWTAKASA